MLTSPASGNGGLRGDDDDDDGGGGGGSGISLMAGAVETLLPVHEQTNVGCVYGTVRVSPQAKKQDVSTEKEGGARAAWWIRAVPCRKWGQKEDRVRA